MKPSLSLSKTSAHEFRELHTYQVRFRGVKRALDTLLVLRIGDDNDDEMTSILTGEVELG